MQRVSERFFGPLRYNLTSCFSRLVELIVLNVGLSAGILSQRVFSMFVLEALLLTFMTTPAVVFLYPPHLRVRVAETGPNFANVPDGESPESSAKKTGKGGVGDVEKKNRFLVVLDRIEHLPGMMSLTQLLQPPPAYTEDDPNPPRHPEGSSSSSSHKRSSSRQLSLPLEPELTLSALRLIELTDRTSAVMKYSTYSVESLIHTDPLLSIFRTFVELGSNGSSDMTSEVRMVGWEDMASSVKEEAMRRESDMVLVPWIPSYLGSDGTTEALANPGAEPTTPKHTTNNPFEALFRVGGGGSSGTTAMGTASSALTAQFIRGVFAQCKTDVALYVDQEHQLNSSPVAKTRKQHLFLPFFGGPDDRLALEFVIQLCSANPRISATIVKVVRQEFDMNHDSSIDKPQMAHIEDGKPAADNLLTVASVSPIRYCLYPNWAHQSCKGYADPIPRHRIWECEYPDPSPIRDC